MYQVYHCIDTGGEPVRFMLRAEVNTRREAVDLAASIRNEGGKKNKSAVYDGNRLVQPLM